MAKTTETADAPPAGYAPAVINPADKTAKDIATTNGFTWAQWRKLPFSVKAYYSTGERMTEQAAAFADMPPGPEKLAMLQQMGA
jgi:hypothetical protein